MIKVLIVDDQQLLIYLMKNLLNQNSEIQVIGSASDGNQAIELAQKYKPDLILMDIMMPNCDGIEATKKIKEIDDKVKILVLTSSDNPEDFHNALESGADGYVLKNISGDDLILAIRSVHTNIDVFNSVDVMKAANSDGSNIPNRTRIIAVNTEIEDEDETGTYTKTDCDYQLLTSIIKNVNGDETLNYGVKIISNNSHDDCATIHDLSSDKGEVEEFILKLKREKVAPNRLIFYAVDFLSEYANEENK